MKDGPVDCRLPGLKNTQKLSWLFFKKEQIFFKKKKLLFFWLPAKLARHSVIKGLATDCPVGARLCPARIMSMSARSAAGTCRWPG
jgi:hypothetical protein